MVDATVKFAQSSGSASGIGAFNINLKSFIFQLITFLIVLYIFKRWILPPIIKTLEQRRQTLEESLEHAKETEETLTKAQKQSEDILAKARNQADEALADAKKTAQTIVSEAEAAAAERAALIIKEAEGRLDQERTKLRHELRKEMAGLVAEATQKILAEKIDTQRDVSLIERAIKAVGR